MFLFVFYPCFIQNLCEFTKLDDIPKNLEKASHLKNDLVLKSKRKKSLGVFHKIYLY